MSGQALAPKLGHAMPAVRAAPPLAQRRPPRLAASRQGSPRAVMPCLRSLAASCAALASPAVAASPAFMPCLRCRVRSCCAASGHARQAAPCLRCRAIACLAERCGVSPRLPCSMPCLRRLSRPVPARPYAAMGCHVLSCSATSAVPGTVEPLHVMSSLPCLQSQARTRLATTSRPGCVSSSQACDASSRLAPSSLFAPCLPCCGAMPAAPTLAAPVVVKSCLVTPCLRCLGLATLAGSSLDFTAVPAVPTCAERSVVEPSLEPSRRAMPAGPGLAMGCYVPSSLATPAVRSPVRRRPPGQALRRDACRVVCHTCDAIGALSRHRGQDTSSAPSDACHHAMPAVPGAVLRGRATASQSAARLACRDSCDACGASRSLVLPHRDQRGLATPALMPCLPCPIQPCLVPSRDVCRPGQAMPAVMPCLRARPCARRETLPAVMGAMPARPGESSTRDEPSCLACGAWACAAWACGGGPCLP